MIAFMRRCSRRLECERGQSSVLGAMLFMILVVFVIFSINAGKLVTDRIHAQNTVDLAAYAGAARQAQALNDMREQNMQAIDAAIQLRMKLQQESDKGPGSSKYLCDGTYCGSCGPKSGAGEADIQQGSTQDIEPKLRRIEQQINKQGVQHVKDSVTATAGANWGGADGKVQWLNETSKIVGLRRAKMQFNYGMWCYSDPVYMIPMQGPASQPTEIDVWVYKDFRDTPDVFVVAGNPRDQGKGMVPDNPLLDLPTTRGEGQQFSKCPNGFRQAAGGRCELYAYGAARPFFGKLGHLPNKALDRQDIQMANQPTVPTANSPQPMLAPDTLQRNIRDRFGDNAEFRKYKARPVGVFEGNDLNPGGGGAQSWMNQIFCPGEQGSTCVQQYMRH